MAITYLIGNGINRAESSGISWSDVLCRLAEPVQLRVEELELKPFPLVFHELTAAYHKKRVTARELRKCVADYVSEIRPGNLHLKIMSRRVNHILTSNYDHSLEVAAGRYKPCDAVWEPSSKYSLFRHNVTKHTRIWHLHGDIDEPRSIILGYDHYTGALERMRQYIKPKRNYKGRSSPYKRGKTNFETSNSHYSWIDLFLRDDVHIIGLGLDYSEIDIWWAITYKNHLLRHGRQVGATHYWAIEADRTRESKVREAKYELMKSLGVSIERVSVSNNNWREGWEQAIDKLPAA